MGKVVCRKILHSSSVTHLKANMCRLDGGSRSGLRKVRAKLFKPSSSSSSPFLSCCTHITHTHTRAWFDCATVPEEFSSKSDHRPTEWSAFDRCCSTFQSNNLRVGFDCISIFVIAEHKAERERVCAIDWVTCDGVSLDTCLGMAGQRQKRQTPSQHPANNFTCVWSTFPVPPVPRAAVYAKPNTRHNSSFSTAELTSHIANSIINTDHLVRVCVCGLGEMRA